MNELLSVTNLRKDYGTQTVLNHVSFTVSQGDFIAIMGPSGSGKSTLLYSMSGMTSITSGEIKFGAERLDMMDEAQLANIRIHEFGFVFQQPYLMKSLSVRENIVLAASFLYHGLTPELMRRAENLMENMKIENLAERGVNELSGGQAQRVGICRALMCNPKILFADEPTGALNSKISDEIMDIFLHLNHTGTTMILVTHDPKVAAKAKSVWFLLDGSIKNKLSLGTWNGSRDSLLSRHEKVSETMSLIEI